MSFTRLFFAPDLDPSWNVNPGVVVAMDNLVPLRRDTYASFGCGSNQVFEVGLTWTSASYGTPLSAYVFKKIVSGARFFVNSKTKIIELVSPSTITDRSKGGGSYSSSTTQWTMVTAGNVILAANYYDPMQVSASGGIFSDLGGGSPKAQCLTANLGFVMAGNYDDGVNQYGDGWWCSALFDYSNWTASLATQAANGRLLDTPGPITCMKPLRDSIIAYKADSVYVGDYIGDTTNGIIWSWRLISNKIGCASPHGVAVLNDHHYFLHRTGAYMLDGAQLTNIGSGINGFLTGFDTDLYQGSWLGTLSGLATVQASIDEIENIVIFLGAVDGTSNISTGPCYNVQTGRWGFLGVSDGPVIAAWQGASTSGKVYALLQGSASDIVAWDSANDGTTLKSVLIGSSNLGTNISMRMVHYNVAPPTTTDHCRIGLGNIGNDDGKSMTTISRVRLRFLNYLDEVATPTLTMYAQGDEIGSAYLDPTVSPNKMGTKTGTWNATENAFDLNVSGRYFVQSAITLVADVELAGISIEDAKVSGRK